MKKGTPWWFAFTLGLAAVLPVPGVAPALAHEGRAAGGVQFVVGWGEEPSYTGVKNSVQVTVTEANGGRPVTDVGNSLNVEVSKGSDKVTLPLQANFRVGGFGTPGDYRAWLTPTRPGTYTFRVMGSLRGQNVDETFTSSNATFDDVQDVASIQFPAKDPSPGQLATRLDRELPRLEARVREAADQADRARTFAAAGVVAGALALVVAAAALAAARSGGRRGTRPSTGESGARSEQAQSLSR